MPRPREFDEEEVLEAAMHLFWSCGYQGASVAALSEATALQRGSLYGAFADKHTLFLRALERYAELMSRLWSETVRGASSPLEALRRGLDGIARDCAGAAGKRGCLVSNTATELLPGDEAAAERVRRNFRAMEALFAGLIAGGKEAGEIRPDVDQRAAARLLVTLVQGLRVRGKASQSLKDVRATIDLALRGLLPS